MVDYTPLFVSGIDGNEIETKKIENRYSTNSDDLPKLYDSVKD